MMITLTGQLERITYCNKDNHYTVARFSSTEGKQSITVVGYLAGVGPGESLKLTGKWKNHPKYGPQFKIDAYEVTLPDTVRGIRQYLASGMIKGIGKKAATRLVDHFGDQTLIVIEQTPDRLKEVEGIGEKTATRISEAWNRQHALRSLMQVLKDHGLQASYGAKIFKQYGPDSVHVLLTTPFQLARDLPDIGFIVADAVSQKSGVPADHPERIRACILFLLDRSTAKGDMFTYEEELTTRCRTLFQIDGQSLKGSLNDLAGDREVAIESDLDDDRGDRIYIRSYYDMETAAANKLKILLTVPVRPPEWDDAFVDDELVKKLAVKLSPEQQGILKEIFYHRAVVITGGPGTGKTTLIRSVTALFDRLGEPVLLAAPTGRAARRMTEVTGRKAVTIHKLLGYNPGSGLFEKNDHHLLDGAAVIIDEASMIDIFLMYHLLAALPPTSILILVGDVFQLPSVGPGNVLADMIDSNVIPVFYLKKIFRQSRKSPIVTAAHAVRQGLLPDFMDDHHPTDQQELYFIEQNQPEKVSDTILDLCSKTIPDRFGFDPVKEIQVITPMHKGAAGTISLNRSLQQRLNPDSRGIDIMGVHYKVGDKVMHLKNDYQKDIFNGDIGVISEITASARLLSVNYDGRPVVYQFDELEDVTPAYAVSVHKSQGSEYPCIILPLLTYHYALLQRNLLYTAVTRGKKLVVIVGSKKAIVTAVKNDQPKRRLSGLDRRLKT